MSSVDEIQAPAELGWYVSDVHCRRAIGYLSAELASRGYLPPDFESSLLLEMWNEALKQTTDIKEPSPIGPEPEHARKFVLTTIEARVVQVENRSDRMEEALSFLNKWLHINMTRYRHKEDQELERILYGNTETTSAKRPYTPK